ncbi:response regulator transcription factor [Clostridium sp. 19966]|uniref:LytR/AlgR family response regulator transcription factor n=1 Tax=Clostridium sp. 19966 TaxID=2768166 RepID=UPI0028DE5118|nr:LytTR family DNA-binding domain-containing protein [Clostridium sp. 19966]MDT8716340.1 response regulator transcription factor [Clostridium sp. 19966]
MIEIIICEDLSSQREEIYNIVSDTISGYDNMKIGLSTSHPKDVLKYVDMNNLSDAIYFLDIELGDDIDGFHLAKEIRNKDRNGHIIFITTHSEMTSLTFKYKIAALDYIIKDDFLKIRDGITDCINEIIKLNNAIKNEDVNDFIHINCGSRIIKIKKEDILFFETSEKIHKINIHLEKKQIEYYGTIKEIEKKLDNNFFRCHRSFLINLNKINYIDKEFKKVVMLNGEMCYLSNKYTKELLNKWYSRV